MGAGGGGWRERSPTAKPNKKTRPLNKKNYVANTILLESKPAECLFWEWTSPWIEFKKNKTIIAFAHSKSLSWFLCGYACLRLGHLLPSFSVIQHCKESWNGELGPHLRVWRPAPWGLALTFCHAGLGHPVFKACDTVASGRSFGRWFLPCNESSRSFISSVF